MDKIMDRMTRMEAEMVVKDERIAVLEAAMDTVNQRIAVLEDSLDTTEDTEDTYSHNFLANSEEVELPPELEVVWSPYFTETQIGCRNTGTPELWNSDWSKSSDSVEANIGMTAEQFYQEVPCKNSIETSRRSGMSGDVYVGQVSGKYNNQKNKARNPSRGPNNETARADEFMVFFKNLTIPETVDGQNITCHWIYKLPQGFSCGKGAPADPACDDGLGRDIFTPVPCSEIEVKVLGSGAENCPLRDEKDKYNTIWGPSKPDCWASVGFK